MGPARAVLLGMLLAEDFLEKSVEKATSGSYGSLQPGIEHDTFDSSTFTDCAIFR